MDDMTIRRATAADIPQIDELLRQVLEVHHAGRPDLFKGGVKKYTDEELKAILANDQTPVFVAVAPSANDGNDAEHNADPPRHRPSAWLRILRVPAAPQQQYPDRYQNPVHR